MDRRRWKTVGLALAAGVLVLTATPAQAVPAASPGPLQGVAAAERRAAAIEPGLRAGLGERFGGSWIDDAGALVVATTDAGDVARLTAAGARAAVVARSQASLDALLDRLNRTRPVDQAVRVWYVEPRTNSVVVLAADVAKGEAFVRAAGVDRAAVRVEPTTERLLPRSDDVRGGDPIVFNGSARCAVGFTVRRGTEQGFITAGHCGRAGAAVSDARTTPPRPLGTVAGSVFPTNDFAYVRLVAGRPGSGLIGRAPHQEVLIQGHGVVPIGSTICSYSLARNWQCGKIQQLNATVNLANGSLYGLTRTNIGLYPGDSGQPYVAVDWTKKTGQALGTASIGSDPSQGNLISFFQPIARPLATYGVTLITTPAP
ncbi:S1 family peptidase [Spongiactinospora rosea]|uniref:S1 family peptidase n=1 Tax=Spongiactinospora rosea TaxID=2248750 RepID=UPI001314FBB0|nr:S1 family peptidase [Spongiactinospora rosea]